MSGLPEESGGGGFVEEEAKAAVILVCSYFNTLCTLIFAFRRIK